MVTQAFNPNIDLSRQRQVNLCVFKDSLLYTEF